MAACQHLTTAELCARLSVDRRTVSDWKKAGCPTAGQRRGRGRPADLWDIDAVRNWVASNLRGGVRTAICGDDDDDDDAPDDDDSAVDLSALSADEITEMNLRLSQKEQTLALLMDRAISAGDHPKFALWHDAWLKTCTARTRLAKELPAIMKARNRFVDVHEVAAAITEACTAFASSLDRVGAAIAETCVGREAPEIALIIDREIAAHRTRLVAALEQIL